MNLLLTTVFCYTITVSLDGLAFWYLFFTSTQAYYIYTKYLALTFKFPGESIPQDTQVRVHTNIIYN